MKRIIVAAVAAAALSSLSGCAAAHTDTAAAAPISTPTPSATPAATPADTLKTAIQGYSNAFLAGDTPGFLAYLHSDCSSHADQGGAVLAAASVHKMAAGATMTVDSVVVDGTRGRVGDWHLSTGAPDALRRALKASATASAKSMPWRYVGGEWYFRSTSCTGGKA